MALLAPKKYIAATDWLLGYQSANKNVFCIVYMFLSY